jgi:hypothetical protein
MDAVDDLLDINDKVRAKDRPFTQLDPVQGCTTATTIQSFEGCHFETLLIIVVVRELRQRQTLVPHILEIQHTSLGHIFKNLIFSFLLTIGLRMISRPVDQLCSQGSMQLLLEMSDKLGPSIINDGLRHIMQTQGVSNI